MKNGLWWFGQTISTLIGGITSMSYGLGVGLAVGYALCLLVDIRFECEKNK